MLKLKQDTSQNKGRSVSTTLLLANQKGGVGKTTLTRELGFYFSLTVGKSVLYVDCDPQANLSKSLCETLPSEGLFDALEGKTVEPVVLRPQLSILPADRRLSSLEQQLVSYEHLKNLLKTYSQYDIILIDTPPGLGLLTLSAMVASRYLIIPMASTHYAMQGANDLLEAMEKVWRMHQSQLELLAVVVGQYNERPVMNRLICKEIFEAFGSLCLTATLSKSIRYEEVVEDYQGVLEAKGHEFLKVKQELLALGEVLNQRVTQ